MRVVKTPEPGRVPLSRNLRLLRKKAGMTQRQLAEEAGLTQAAISRIEAGKIRDVRSATLDALARALGVTPAYLAGRSEQMPPADATRFDPGLSRYAGMFALLSPDAVNRVFGFISSEAERAKKTEGRTHGEAAAAKDMLPKPQGTRQPTRPGRKLRRRRRMR